MRVVFTLIPLLLLAPLLICGQGIGIGTNSPNSKAILHLQSTTQGFYPPAMTNAQMDAITNPPPGLMIYNNEKQSLMVYAQVGFQLIGLNTFAAKYSWTPVSIGPRMIAWGVVDSFATELNGSQNFNVSWNNTENWFELTMLNIPFYKDSMMLIITPIGNGSWDQVVSVGELVSGNSRRATIKFTDVSRVALGFSAIDSRRRSSFSFVMYSMRRDPF